MDLQGTSLIGQGRGARSENPTRALEASTGNPIDPPYHWASRKEVDAAVERARTAFESHPSPTPIQRAELLRSIAERIEQHTDTIVARALRETALPEARLRAETQRTTGQLRLFARLVDEGWWVDARIDHGDPQRTPVPKPDVRSMLHALGPVAVFSSSNFPLAFSVAGGDTASALAAGCPVIVKAHEGHLGTSELVGMLVRDAVRACGLHEGFFSLLFGPGRDVGMALVRHPEIRAVGFTGSRSGGRALMDAAAARAVPIPVFAEMGSINPVFILPEALRERAESIATGLHASVTLGAGQFCTNPGLVFVADCEQTGFFLDTLTRLMRATAPAAMLTPSIREKYGTGVARFAEASGVRCLARVEAAEPLGGAALFSTDIDTFLKTPLLMEEVFGPTTLVVQCGSHEMMLKAAHLIEGQLTATVHAEEPDYGTAAELIGSLNHRVGRVLLNGFPTGVEVCHAMHHGGPYPATSDGRSTSVGTRAITRFARPVCYQNVPDPLLPEALREANPLLLLRLVDGKWGVH